MKVGEGQLYQNVFSPYIKIFGPVSKVYSLPKSLPAVTFLVYTRALPSQLVEALGFSPATKVQNYFGALAPVLMERTNGQPRHEP